MCTRLTNGHAAIDIDLNGLIEINEVNKFTSAQPPGIALMEWIAYNAYGE